jgi:hypothetical protein
MNLETLDVVIAGAGIGGLWLAALLARRGARVAIYDQMNAPQPVGSGFVLQPTRTAILSQMGLLDQVDARGARISRCMGACLAIAGRFWTSAIVPAPAESPSSASHCPICCSMQR